MMGGFSFLHFFIVFLIPIVGMGVAAFGAYLFFRNRGKAIDVLRVYAERGEEPPERVFNALVTPNTRDPRKVQKRAEKLGRGAGGIVVAAGFVVIGFWAGGSFFSFVCWLAALIASGVGVSSLVSGLAQPLDERR